MVFTNQDGHVLLVEPTYKPDREIPGGAVEADDSPCATAIREIAEELRLDVRPGRLLAVEWVPAQEGRTEGLMLLFDGGALTAQTSTIRLPGEEIHSWAWCDPSHAQQRLSGLLARRVAALDARTAGTNADLENGHA
ncbi:NUDIX domain-containing protein [Actinoplanes sp. CA-030573]|uniref:NUDIX domain-containing protein n=1 Tax=Actinoplanes sp. CA-030573 TaxID=3239898 RepID=UPI003D8C6ED0